MRSVYFHNVTVKFGRLVSLDNLSFSVRKGEIAGLVGPNGCGKSTVMKVLCGLIKPEKGSVFIDNYLIKPSGKEFKRLIGYAPQENSFFGKLTVKENMSYFSDLYDIKGDRKTIIENFSESLGIYDKVNVLAENLSGGMKRRLNIACSILHSPEILLLDEPSIELDPVSRIYLWNLIRWINQQGTTIIIATNMLDEAKSLCKKVVFMERGKCIAEGSPDEVIDKMIRRFE
jgi:ABC-2 type transport system ATP-binding protein